MSCLPICSSAKQGRSCNDDLCRTAAAGGGETLCGFDQLEYDRMTAEYFDDPNEPDEDLC